MPVKKTSQEIEETFVSTFLDGLRVEKVSFSELKQKLRKKSQPLRKSVRK